MDNPAPAAGSSDGFEQVFFSAGDGLRLAARDYGRNRPGTENRNPVVCLAGLTRNSADFHRLAVLLSTHGQTPRRVVCFDARGRGLSDRDSNKANYVIHVETEDVLAGCLALDVRHAAFIGTSRGALIVHALAAVRPGIVTAAVLNDTGPVIEGQGLVQIMASHARIKALGSVREVADVLKSIQGAAFTALADEDWREMAAGNFEDRDGKAMAKFDPALIEMMHAIDFNQPLPTLWPQFAGLRRTPMLTIRGENSTLFRQGTVEAMARVHPAMRRHTARGQGHAPVLHVGELPALVRDFLDDADGKAPPAVEPDAGLPGSGARK